MHPVYLNLSDREFNQRIEKLFKILKNCQICPRKCQVNRIKDEKGVCGLGFLPVVSAFHPHFGEERILVGPSTNSGQDGSGTIFFTSCNLNCVYCQNYDISQLRIGEEVSFEKLAEMMIKLQERGCHNINFVTPTCQAPQILKALVIARDQGLKIPLVYNTNAYDSVETLKLLDGIIDIYMPDAKYSDDEIALKYSNVPDYFEIMKAGLKEMHSQVGDLVIDEKGIAQKGLLIRHLILPNGIAGSKKILEFIVKEISKESFVNLLSQYYPAWKAKKFPEINRGITEKELEEVVSYAEKLGLSNFIF